MNAMKNKIKSQRGASITFALLLFLVCAIISGVVIVAATAAAGRMSGQVDMDGRYYAVTAVASKLKNELENQTVTLQYQEDKPEEATVVEDVSVLLATVSKDLLKAVISGNDEVDSGSFITIPVKNSTVGTTNSDGDGKDDTEDNSNEVTCSVSKKVTNSGLLVFDIVATGGNLSKGSYKLSVTFSSKLKYHATDVNKTDKTATLTWKLINLRKIRSDYIT